MWRLARGRQIAQHLFTALDRVDLASNRNPSPKVHKMDPGFLIIAQEQAAKAHFRCSLFPDIISPCLLPLFSSSTGVELHMMKLS